MPNLKSLPTDIIQLIVQHLDYKTSLSPFLVASPSATNMLSLSSVCKRMRRVIFDDICMKEHRMNFTFAKIEETTAVLLLPMRKKVQLLVLYGSCDEGITRPSLTDYVKLFPNLKSIHIDFIYPRGRSYKHHQFAQFSKSTPQDVPKASARSLQSVSVCIHKAIEWHGTRQEKFVGMIIPHIKASMKAIGIDRLDEYELEVATSRSMQDRESANYWKDLETRVMKACAIPAAEVALEFGELRMNGEVGSFLDIIEAAVKGWPKCVEGIAIQVPVDDFMKETRNKDKFIVDKKGRMTVAKGWFPTEKMMSTFINRLKKARPSLRNFRLVILVRSCAFSMVLCKPIFEFSYTKRDNEKAKATNGRTATGTKDQPIDVENFVATSASKAKRTSEPEHYTGLDQSVVQELYDAMQDAEDAGEMSDEGSDGYDGFEEDICSMQEVADMDAGIHGEFEEDDEQGESFGSVGGRPRWAAY